MVTPSSPSQRPYHHGHLRQAVIDMAVLLAEERGQEQISLREVARRLGVSPGAPFRHFANHGALMTAIAEEATLRLRLCVERDLHHAPQDPIGRLKGLGHSFLDWALQNPTQFRIVSSRRLFDFDASSSLRTHFATVRELTTTLVEAAQAAGALPSVPTDTLALSLRAAAYGLARMHLDGQLPQWGVAPANAHQTIKRALDQLIDGLRPSAPPP